MKRLNVDRMRRYRARTSGGGCATCRDLDRRQAAIEPNTIAAFEIGGKRIGHIMRDHPADGVILRD